MRYRLQPARIRHLRNFATQLLVASFVALVAAGGSPAAFAQQKGAPATAQARAPIDLTGYWVSVITEDWRWRMVTPPKGDTGSVPLNAQGQRAAQNWDLAQDLAQGNQCRPFGVGGIMRLPGRLHITWQDPNALKIETDAGTQTRLLHFGKPQPGSGERTWQGQSFAQWDFGTLIGGGAPRPGTPGSLRVRTTHMRAGYVRKNGVPYSEDAVVNEYFDRDTTTSDGAEWLSVMTIVDDSKFYTEPFVTNSIFKKEPDGSKWHPTGCETAPASIMASPENVR